MFNPTATRRSISRYLTVPLRYHYVQSYCHISQKQGTIVIHHIFAGLACWGGMFPGCCHFYAIFYFGLSEISTAILCLLANFDDNFGVIGLDKVFPKTKIVLGALFVTSFIFFRCIMWPFVTHHFWKDTSRALTSNNPLAAARKNFLHLLRFCCAGLSLIQFVFVAMIVQTGKEELAKLMN